MIRAIVIGKFYPPHKGHKYLIDYALAHSDSLTVLVCDSPEYKISAPVRQAWLQHIHPAANVVIIPDIGQDDNSKAWARHTLRFLGYTPDVVFSSEDYGIAYAQYMNTKHVMVDRDRTHIPISATKVRGDLFEQWPFLTNTVKHALAIRITVIGAESTGTTTLTKALAKKFEAPWVSEFGRFYTEAFLTTQHSWTDEEFVHIAATQQSFENQVAVSSNGLIFCDTNAFATSVWQERYMGSPTQKVRDIADKDIVDLYILTGDEIPFEQDGTRDGEAIRHEMHQRFANLLKNQDIPYIVVTGSKEDRLAVASKAVQAVLKQGAFEQSIKHLSPVALAH